MNVFEYVKKRIMEMGQGGRVDNPTDTRLTYITDADNIKRQSIEENKVWYIGDGNELLNYYTNEQVYGSYKEPIYNRNKRNYFWAISSTESNIKRVHSGIPNAIVSTLVNAIGNPKIVSKTAPEIDNIIEKNDLLTKINQEQMPFTLVEGYGAFKVNIDKALCDYPIIEYYGAEDVEFCYKSGVLIGIIYKSYYTQNGKNYLLLETRRISNTDSIVEYELFKLEENNYIAPVPLETIPELAGLTDICIPNFRRVLGVPSKFFFDVLNKNYGKSIFSGKVDLFDDLDQDLSQNSQTVRVSTPVEYFPTDLLERNGNGRTKLPNMFNRQFVQKDSIPNGDGAVDGTIQTTQPQLNFEQYSANAKHILDFILTGVLSPATMGIDIAKKDNADAQREKEKVTIMTRNNIIFRQTKILRELLEISLAMQEYINTGNISLKDYKISVTFDEFANPSFENELQVLGAAWSNGEISTGKYVELLWGDKISDEEKAIEIAWLDSNKAKDTLQFGELEDENPVGTDSINEEEETQDFRNLQE